MENMLKREMDLVVGMLAFIILSPIFLFIAILVKKGDGAPIFYRGIRVGRNGNPFRIFKFRTMVVNADTIGGSSTANDDPRITKIGKKLRKYKLDELPQIINVLRGDMSLVGPRPEVQRYVDMYTPEERIILSVRPGITDWASLWNSDEGALLAGANDPEQFYMEKIRPEKIRLQMEYVRRRNVLIDLNILAKTIWTILARPVQSQ